MRRSAATAVLSSATAAVLLLLRPHPVAVAHRVVAPTAMLQTDPDGAIGDAAATLLWLVAGWLAIGITVTLLASIPGATGRLFGAASRRLLPCALRRVVAGSAGLGVLLAPIPAAVATSSAPTHQLVAAALPAPVWPGASAPVDRPDPPPQPPRAVRVHKGDSLWLIAAHRLGRHAEPGDIAATWPRWYAANRAVIGDDPNLIRPGQLLQPPDGPHRNGPRR